MWNFLLHVLALCLVYSTWGAAAGVLVTRLDQLSLAVAAVAGTAAYCFAATQGAAIPWLIAAGAGAVVGAALHLAALRVRGHDFALTTFSIMVAWQSFVGAADRITGGPFGISRVPPLPMPLFDPVLSFCALAVGLLVAAVSLERLESSRRVRTAAEILARSRDHARAMGVPAAGVVLIYGAVAGFLCGLAGAILIAYIGYVGPSSLTITTSVLILALGLAWAIGWQVFAGAVGVTIALPELLRLVAPASLDSASLRTVLAGAALLVLGFLQGSTMRGRSS